MKKLLRYKKDAKLAFFDFETEGLCLYLPENLPWELGLLTVQGGEIQRADLIHMNGWHRPVRVSKEAARITGFNQANYERSAIDQKEVFEKVLETFRWADYIIGHNIFGFDYCLLKQWYDMHGQSSKSIERKLIDTKSLASAIKSEIPFDIENDDFLAWQLALSNHREKGVKTNLGAMADHYGAEYDKSKTHQGLYDIEKLNWPVYQKMIWDLEI